MFDTVLMRLCLRGTFSHSFRGAGRICIKIGLYQKLFPIIVLIMENKFLQINVKDFEISSGGFLLYLSY